MNIAPEHLTTGEASCFLPGTNIQFAWDSTSLGLLKTCPRLYQYVMIEGWAGKGESVHLRWGQEYHSALEDYDRAKALGADHENAIRQSVLNLLTRTHGWVPTINEEKRSEALKTKENLFRTVIDYLDHFADDPAETYILADGKPAVELSFRLELEWGPKAGEVVCPRCGGSGFQGPETGYDGVCSECGGQRFLGPAQPYLLCGHLDRVVNYLDALYVMDRKTTTTTLGSYYFAQYEPHNQMTLYTMAGQIILRTPVKGVVIDAVQIMANESRFVRGMTFRTPDQLAEWKSDLRYWFGLAEFFAHDNYWPMNDTACDKFGGCRFRGICSKSPSVREKFLAGSFTKQPLEERWNPLRSR